MDEKKLNDLIDQIDGDLAVVLPHIVTRMKKRVLLAYLLGVQDGKEQTERNNESLKFDSLKT